MEKGVECNGKHLRLISYEIWLVRMSILWCKFTDRITVVCKYSRLTYYLTHDYNLFSTNFIAPRADLVWILVRIIEGGKRNTM